MQHRAPDVGARRVPHVLESGEPAGAVPVRLDRIPDPMRMPARESPLCVTTTPDRAGRLADRSPLRHLGWSQQTLTRFDVRSNAVVVVTADGSTSSITGQGHLQLPLAVRRRCRIEAGVRLLLVAWRDTGRLVVCTAAAVEGMVLAELSVLGTRAGGRW